MWERSFVAVSVLVSDPLSNPSDPHDPHPNAPIDDAMAALPEGASMRIGELARKLRDPRRAVRAQGLAAVAQEVALAIGEVTLR